MLCLVVGMFFFSGCVGVSDPEEHWLIMQDGYPIYPHAPLGVISLGGLPYEDIKLAVSFWNDIAEGEVFYLDPSAGTVTAERTDPLGVFLGLARPQTENHEIIGCRVRISSTLDNYETVLFHEFGHCLGLADDGGTGYLMAGDSKELSPTDVELVREIANLQNLH